MGRPRKDKQQWTKFDLKGISNERNQPASDITHPRVLTHHGSVNAIAYVPASIPPPPQAETKVSYAAVTVCLDLSSRSSYPN